VEQHTPQLWQRASTPAPSTTIVVGLDCNLTSEKNSHGGELREYIPGTGAKQALFSSDVAWKKQAFCKVQRLQ
jgi:hypothetical protein